MYLLILMTMIWGADSEARLWEFFACSPPAFQITQEHQEMTLENLSGELAALKEKLETHILFVTTRGICIAKTSHPVKCYQLIHPINAFAELTRLKESSSLSFRQQRIIATSLCQLEQLKLDCEALQAELYRKEQNAFGDAMEP